MKRISLALAALMLSAGVASAADIYGGSIKDDRDYTPDVQRTSWTGFSVGFGIGYGNTNHDLTIQRFNNAYCWDQFGDQLSGDEDEINGTVAPEDVTLPIPDYDGGLPFNLNAAGNCDHESGQPFSEGVTAGVYSNDSILVNPSSKELANLNGINSHGVIGEAEIGYDQQIGRVVVGVFGSYAINDMRTEFSINDLVSGSIEKGDEWSLGGRIGVVPRSDTLLYILAAYTQTDYDFRLGDESTEVTFDGVSVGGGLEHAITNNIFVDLRYTHTFYGEEEVVEFGETPVGAHRLLDQPDEDKVVAKIKWKFN